MNAKILGAFLLALTMSGCIIDVDQNGGGGGAGNPPPVQRVPGDVTFTWSFGGQTCADVPYVKSVHIRIPGEALQNSGVFPCTANDYPGIVLHDFAGGAYSFEIEALDYSNVVVFSGSGTFTVDGHVRVNIDLTPVGGPTSYAYLTWRFPANEASQNPNCSQAGVAYVDVSIDDGEWERFYCTEGFSEPGISTPYLMPGTHVISLVASNADGYPYYRFDGQLQTFAGNPVGAQYHLNWAVGGAAVKWQLTNGSVAQTCAQAGVSEVYVNFADADGNFVYEGAGDVQSCNAAPVIYSFLLPGTYTVFVQAVSNTGMYASNMNHPPVISVKAGQFVDASGAINVQMFRE